MTSPTRSRRLLAGTVLALLIAGGTAACGASGGSDADRETTTTAPKSTTTVEEATTTTSGDDETTTTTEGTDEGSTTTAVDEPAGDADRQEYVDALKESFDTGTDSTEQYFDSEQVNCLAESYVDVIGVDNLHDADVSPAELGKSSGDGPLPKELGIDEDGANELYDQFAGCDIDLAATFKKVFSQISGKALTPAQEACVDKAVTDENLRKSFVADFSGVELDPDPLDAAGTCVGF
ncbi:hypothetical protein BH10ACT1_BH10ACT1_24600 [soil metagenome]